MEINDSSEDELEQLTSLSKEVCTFILAALFFIILQPALDKLLYVRTYVQFIDEFLWLHTVYT